MKPLSKWELIQGICLLRHEKMPPESASLREDVVEAHARVANFLSRYIRTYM